MTSGPTRVRCIALLSLPDLVDGIRARRQLVLRACAPLALLLVVASVTLVADSDRSNRRQGDFTVAVEGDRDGARRTLDALGAHRLEFVATDDAAIAVSDGADAGLLLPDRLDERLAAGDRIVLDVIESTARPSSRVAVVLFENALIDRFEDQVRAVATMPDERIVSLEVITVEATTEGIGLVIAQLVPGLLALQAAMLVTGAANRLAGRRGAGVLVAQLLLPVRRGDVAASKALSELLIGSLVSLPVLVPVTLFALISSLDDLSVVVVLSRFALVLVTFVVLGAVASAAGAFIGLAARAQEQVALGTGAVLVFAALVVAFVAFAPRSLPAALAIVPFAGTVSALRSVLTGDGGLTALAVSYVTTLAVGVGLARATAKVLGRDRMVLRQ